jgi:hypothetical protein
LHGERATLRKDRDFAREVKNTWLFPALEAIHVAGLALSVGTIVMVDLRMLGSGQMANPLRGWTHAGLALMLITGLTLFWSDAARYVHNPAFILKMVFLLLALISYFSPRKGRLAAVLSLALWSGVVIGGRGIADFDI